MKNESKTDNKKYETEDVEKILKRKKLQNIIFEKMISDIEDQKLNKVQIITKNNKDEK